MKPMKSLWPTAERTSESCSRTVLSWEDKCTCTLGPEFRDSTKLREREDIKVTVRERVPRTPECPRKFYGWEDKEYWEDSWENTERARRSLKISTITSIWLQRVTNSRTSLYWLKLSTKWSKRRSERSNWLTREKPEGRRIKKERRRESTESWSKWDWQRKKTSKRNQLRRNNQRRRKRRNKNKKNQNNNSKSLKLIRNPKKRRRENDEDLNALNSKHISLNIILN